jgi:hypothetical protein
LIERVDGAVMLPVVAIEYYEELAPILKDIKKGMTLAEECCVMVALIFLVMVVFRD